MRTKIYKTFGCSFFSMLLAGTMFVAPISAYASTDISKTTEFDKAEARMEVFGKKFDKQELSPEVTIHIPNADWLPNYYAQKEAERIAAEEAARRAAEEAQRVQTKRASKQYSSGGNYDYSGGQGILTRSGGVNYYNGRKETWYSQRVLPGGGLNIPGRHVREDGVICDGDGYVCVAASDLKKGAVVETSRGTAKVYDTGCAAGTTDVYVDW